MATSMTSQEWRDLSRLASKAAYYELEVSKNEGNFDILRNVSAYAGRMS